MRYLLITITTALLVLVGASTSQAYHIRPVFHRPNHGNNTGGYCTWASTTTLLRSYGYNVDLVSNRIRSHRGGPAHLTDVASNLERRGIPHVYHNVWTRKVVEPSIVSMRWMPNVGHAIVRLRTCNGFVYYYDPNHPGTERRMSLKEFKSRWLGNSLVITPPRHRR